MLNSRTRLRDELIELDRDMDGLGGRRVALIGFRDPNVTRVAENLQVLGQTPGWAVVDHRDAGLAGQPKSFIQALESPKFALVLDAGAAVPTDASLLIRALHDSCDGVVWANGMRSPLPAQRILYVVAVGARSAEDLPEFLQMIDFMRFIPRQW